MAASCRAIVLAMLHDLAGIMVAESDGSPNRVATAPSAAQDGRHRRSPLLKDS